AGLPVDVAETIAWLASPGSAGINGQVVRVCGQHLVGAGGVAGVGVEELSEGPRLPALYGRARYGGAAGAVWRWPGGRVGPRRGAALPETERLLREVTADRAALAEYARVCGFPVTDTLPVTYPHVLAFPLALALMTAPGFPLPAAGLVHVANRIVALRPLDAA